MARLRCVLAEDEHESRINLVAYVSSVPNVDLVGVAANGSEAVALVDGARPDLLLLDIRLPEMDGFEVLRRVRHRPEVVFTTAYDGYAVSAFELGAIDYLVKPFGKERVAAAIERVRARRPVEPDEAPGLSASRGPAGSDSIERALAATSRPVRRLFARNGGRIVPIAVGEIVRICASGEYSEIHTSRDVFLVQITLTELLMCLDPEVFERVHRSHIVNFDAVDHLRAADDRRLLVTLRDGTTILASRAASERIRQRVR
jgi:two-component system LytT family response regulator